MIHDPSAIFFLACCAVFMMSLLGAPDDELYDSIGVSLVLGAAWWWSHLLIKLGGDPANWYWLSDCVQTAIIGSLWAASHRRCKLAILMALMTKSAITVGYWLPSWTGTENDYKLALNILYGIELLCAAFPGGRGLASIARHRLLSYRRRYRRAVHASGREAQREGTP